MRRLAEIDLLEDVALRQRMVWSSAAILVLGTALGVLGWAVLPHEAVGLLWFVALGLVSVLVLPVHELVHAAAFKLLTGFSARVTFGFENGMLFTSSAGTILAKGRFCAVLLAPTTVLTPVLLLSSTALGYPLLGWMLATIHLSGCTGDIFCAMEVAREPHANLVMDTPTGIALFQDDL